jgi:hypothetical protein
MLVSVEELRSMELVSEGGILFKMPSLTLTDNFNLQRTVDWKEYERK